MTTVIKIDLDDPMIGELMQWFIDKKIHPDQGVSIMTVIIAKQIVWNALYEQPVVETSLFNAGRMLKSVAGALLDLHRMETRQ